MKKYFNYGCCTMCGIPWVTLEGSVADWEDILGRIEKLREYELEEWYQMLKPIFEQFVEAKKGKENANFWNRICDYHSGSGYKYISGWITAFCVFDKEGNWQAGNCKSGEHWPRIQTIPSGIVEVDVKIDDNGTLYNSVMFAGHMAYEILDGELNNDTLKPTTGLAICLKPDPEEIERIQLAQAEASARYLEELEERIRQLVANKTKTAN